MTPEPMRAAQVVAAPNVLFGQSKIVSRDLAAQPEAEHSSEDEHFRSHQAEISL